MTVFWSLSLKPVPNPTHSLLFLSLSLNHLALSLPHVLHHTTALLSLKNTNRVFLPPSCHCSSLSQGKIASLSPLTKASRPHLSLPSLLPSSRPLSSSPIDTCKLTNHALIKLRSAHASFCISDLGLYDVFLELTVENGGSPWCISDLELILFFYFGFYHFFFIIDLYS